MKPFLRTRTTIARYSSLFCLVVLAIACAPVVQADAEVIHSFDTAVTIQKDGAAIVTETIVYDFGSLERHGIYRDIPLAAENGPQLEITVKGVTDERGNAYTYTTSLNGNVLDIRIGDPAITVTGGKTYVIEYIVYGAIRPFDDHDEFYWNATGNEWPVGIESATVSVRTPGVAAEAITTACFTGARGSTKTSCSASIEGDTARYETSVPLQGNEGLTIVLGMPARTVENAYVPTAPGENAQSFDVLGIFLPFLFITIFISSIVFRLVRRSSTPKPRPVVPRELRGQPVVVAYDPPAGLSPIDVGTILDRSVDVRDISSVILDLAVRGYLKIRYVVEEIPFWPDKKDFEFIKVKRGEDLTHPADRIIFDLLFGGRNVVRLSELEKKKETFQSTIKDIKKRTDERLFDEGYFDRAGTRLMKAYGVYGVVAIVALFIGSFFVGMFFGEVVSIFIFSGIVIIVVLTLIVNTLNHKLTAKGLLIFANILGFREFLHLTEKDRLAVLNAPSVKPETFEKFLPYAMVLGVENEWAEKFEGIYNTAPGWYEDSQSPVFTSSTLVRNMALFDASFNHVFTATAPRSSSGFSGGSSGGGSGGGGGGSW